MADARWRRGSEAHAGLQPRRRVLRVDQVSGDARAGCVDAYIAESDVPSNNEAQCIEPFVRCRVFAFVLLQAGLERPRDQDAD